tara:strand:+ start:11265 stop:12764 length:1500 start_codon:yes stop_codon:yes gene_type:complete
MESCECIKITYQTALSSATIDANTTGIFNGYNTFEFVADGVIYYIWHDAIDNWNITTDGVGGLAFITGLKNTFSICPIGETPEWLPNEIFSNIIVEYGTCGICTCISIEAVPKIGEPFIVNFNAPSGWFNGSQYWSWCIGEIGYYLFLFTDGETCQWQVRKTKCGLPPNLFDEIIFLGLKNDFGRCGCPFDTPYTPVSEDWLNFYVNSCEPQCVEVEDRHQRKYDAIQLPVIFEEQNRGWKGCCDCEPMLTLASPDPETWKNDVTSAWIKLSDPTDTVQFGLMKNGVDATYIPTTNAFVNESDAYYTTIRWIDVLTMDGVGCYELIVKYNISGIINEFVWGAYNVKPYTIENALQTARIRVKFNLQQEIENINFTGSNIEDTVRFYGFIGERQPNMEIDNLIYQNRGMKTVVRENLNTYKITTDPSGECLLTKLTDLYLLSENELFISDYNAHNHSYKYLDLPVVVQESPEIDYLDILQRKAILTCEVGDRNKNKRTFY